MSKLDDDPGVHRVICELVEGYVLGGAVVGTVKQLVAARDLDVCALALDTCQVGQPVAGPVALSLQFPHPYCVVCLRRESMYEVTIGFHKC